MTQEERHLLLVDLCARSPYGVRVCVDESGLFIPTLTYIEGAIICHFKECAWTRYIDEIKPYLRPMSSMIEEEREELERLSEEYFGKALDKQIQESLSSSNRNESRILEYTASSVIIDWLNSHHFDYRGLIPMGLALEAPEGMYDI